MSLPHLSSVDGSNVKGNKSLSNLYHIEWYWMFLSSVIKVNKYLKKLALHWCKNLCYLKTVYLKKVKGSFLVWALLRILQRPFLNWKWSSLSDDLRSARVLENNLSSIIPQPMFFSSKNIRSCVSRVV